MNDERECSEEAYEDVFDSYDSTLTASRLATAEPIQKSTSANLKGVGTLFAKPSLAAVSPELKPVVSESPLAPSPETTNQQLSSASSSAQRVLHFGAPGSFLPAQQPGNTQLQGNPFQVYAFGSQALQEAMSDSESERISKQHFYEQTEAQWRASHASEPVDYALLNRLHSDSLGLESSSSPDKSPFTSGNRQAGQTASRAQLGTNDQVCSNDAISHHSGSFAIAAEPSTSNYSLNSPASSSHSAAALTSASSVPAALLRNAAKMDQAASAAVISNQAAPPANMNKPGNMSGISPPLIHAEHAKAVMSSNSVSCQQAEGSQSEVVPKSVQQSAATILRTVDASDQYALKNPSAAGLTMAASVASAVANECTAESAQEAGKEPAQAAAAAAADHLLEASLADLAQDNAQLPGPGKAAALTQHSSHGEAEAPPQHSRLSLDPKPQAACSPKQDTSWIDNPSSPASQPLIDKPGLRKGTSNSPFYNVRSPRSAPLTDADAHRASNAKLSHGMPRAKQHSPGSATKQAASPSSERDIAMRKITELQKQLNSTQAKLQVELEGRYAATMMLSSHKKDAAASEKRLKEAYENRIRDKQIELHAAVSRLQQIEGLDPKSKLTGAAQVTLTEAEVRSLRRDMQEQERLIQGYQTENEGATQKIKQMKLEHKHAEQHLAEENIRLQRLLAHIQEQGVQTKAAEAPKLTAVLHLEAQLDTAREQAAQHEAELQCELQQARRERKEMEAQLAGLDVNQMEAEDSVIEQVQAEKDGLLAELRRQITDMQRQHDSIAAELQGKLQWYAENRDLVNQNSETIRHQAETIEGLTAQLGKQQGPAGKGSKADRSRIKELEEDNESLKAALKARHPDSLPALIAAAKPSPQESAIVVELQTKLKSLQAALVRKDEEMDKELRSLRQQHEQLKHRFQAHKPLQGVGQENRGRRLQELEGQLQEVRTHYHHKVRSLENRLQEADKRASSPKPGISPPKHSNATARTSSVKTKQNAAAKRQLQQSLAEQSALVQQLRDEIVQLKAGKTAGGTKETGSSWTDDHLAESLNDMHQPAAPQLSLKPAFLQGNERSPPAEPATHDDSIPANATHHRLGERSQNQSAAAPAAPYTAAGAAQVMPCVPHDAMQRLSQAEVMPEAPSDEKQRLSQALAQSEQRVVGIEVALSSMQKAHREAVEHAARLQAEHQRQLTLVFQQHTAQIVELQRTTQQEESLRWRQQVASLQGHFQGAKGRADRLEEELQSARACIPWTPAAHEYAELEKKINELEAQQQSSAHAQSTLESTGAQQWLLPGPQAAATSRTGIESAGQDREIEHFRAELESILAIAQQLQQQEPG